MKQWWWFVIVLESSIFVHTSSQQQQPVNEHLFLCQPTSAEKNDAKVFTPNISDGYFDPNTIDQFRREEKLSPASFVTDVFSVPDESEERRNCSGKIVAIEYCYQVINKAALQDNEQTVFTFHSLMPAGRGGGQSRNFTVNGSYMVQTTSSRECTANEEYCCDRTMLNTQLPSSSYAFGVKVNASSIRLLRFNTPTPIPPELRNFIAERSQNCIFQTTPFPLFNCAQFNGPVFLLRLLIAKGNTHSSNSVATPLDKVTSIEMASPSIQDETTSTETTNESTVALIAGSIVGVVALAATLTVLIIIVTIHKCLRKKFKDSGVTLGSAVYGMNNIGESKHSEYAQIGPESGHTTAEPNGYEYTTIGALQYEIPTVSNQQNTNSHYEMDPSLPQNGMEDVYMVPAKDETTLYAQLQDIMTRIVARSSVQLGERLGSGQFGVVYKGVLECGESEGGKVEVAVKSLKEGSGEEDRVKFLQEAAIMGQFKHHNVVTMYGVVTVGEPVLLILELLTKGDLRKHLLQMISNEDGEVRVDELSLLSYCRQVASGMAYLSSKAFVHRDLAARNILVSSDDICKIADFGMSRDLMDESYYVSHGGKIPVKWTAPEALHYKKYSTASDVWSYGALMYEIWSVGHKPFENETNSKVMRLLESGYRLPPPPGCPRALYHIMITCWHAKPSQRPKFQDVNRQLSLPDPKLLKWSEEDKAVHPEAAKLGADLLSAQDLYKDLQTLNQSEN